MPDAPLRERRLPEEIRKHINQRCSTGGPDCWCGTCQQAAEAEQAILAALDAELQEAADRATEWIKERFAYRSRLPFDNESLRAAILTRSGEKG